MTQKTIISILALLFTLCNTIAQNDSHWQAKPKVNIGGFVDAFYVYDFNQPAESKRQPYLFNHNRHNEFNINLALFQINVNHEKYRLNLGLQSGTYAQDNYAGEAEVFRNIYEANVGVSLNKENTLWLDAGLFPSNLGFESAISMDNMTLTRSLTAESSPYFLTGAKLTYNYSEKLAITALVTNGWQRIERLPNNSIPSFGTQVNYQLSDEVNLNWSTFIGSEYPDSLRRMRYFNNFYSTIELSDKWNATVGIDVGFEQRQKNSSAYHLWYVPTAILQYKYDEKWSIAVRGEFITDDAGVVIGDLGMESDGIWGASLNIDYAAAKNVVCRIEGRYLGLKDEEFNTLSSSRYSSFFIGSSLAIKFGQN